MHPVGPGMLRVEWTAPVEGQRNGKLTSYKIGWTRVAEEESVLRRAKGAGGHVLRSALEDTKVDIDQLDTHTLYRLTVTAGTADGFGPDSRSVQKRTSPDGQFLLSTHQVSTAADHN